MIECNYLCQYLYVGYKNVKFIDQEVLEFEALKVLQCHYL